MSAFIESVRGGQITYVAEQLDKNSELANSRDKNDLSRSALHIAVMCGSAEIVEILLASGASVNCQDSRGDTPLHEAALRDDMEMVRLLLSAGADRKMRPNGGWSATSAGHNRKINELFRH